MSTFTINYLEPLETFLLHELSRRMVALADRLFFAGFLAFFVIFIDFFYDICSLRTSMINITHILGKIYKIVWLKHLKILTKSKTLFGAIRTLC